jgi:Na+/proline symporter
MGLAALSLQDTVHFPTYPNPMTESEVSAGLTLPYAAVALLGSGGAVATLLIVFMAVTSAFSAQLIAVSSILTYDIYGTTSTPKQAASDLSTSRTLASLDGASSWQPSLPACSTLVSGE